MAGSPAWKGIGLAACLVAAVALVAAAYVLASGGGTTTAAGPDDFLDRVEAALRTQGEVVYVTGETIATDGPVHLWSSEAWYDFEAGAVVVSTTKAPGNQLDIPDHTLQLRLGEDVYVAYPGVDEAVQRFSSQEWTACLYYDEPEPLVIGLLCGLGPQEGEAKSWSLEGPADFHGRPVLSLALEMTDGRVLRLFVDPSTHLPAGQSMALGEYALETAFQVEALPRSALPSDYFDPRSLGYVPPEEAWLQILDDPALGVSVFWPGRALTGTGTYDAVLTRVDDRRGPPGKDTPGHVLSLDYEGNNGRFRLDYWPAQTWEAFLALLGDGFLWASCSESVVSSVSAGELTILQGFEPGEGIEALRPAQVAGPGPGSTTTVPAFDPFPNGCPDGDYARFMAVVRTPDGVITINVPYGYCCQDGNAFGAFDTEDGLRAIAERLTLRRAGE